MTTMRATLERPIKAYIDWWYGAANDPQRQYQFYRCELCRSLVTWRQIAQGGCRCGVSSRVRAAHLKWHEKLRILFLPWTV